MRTWADIRFDSLAANLAALRRRLLPQTGILLPVKANAYGHGAVGISRWARELGVEWLGVATPDEARELRQAGIGLPILLFGPLPPHDLDDLRSSGVTPTLVCHEDAVRWARAAPGCPAHVEVDSGMGRAGIDWRRRDELARLGLVEGLRIEGVYTHFAAGENEPAFTLEQERRFREALDALAEGGVRPSIVHLANSAAVFRHGFMQASLARPGIAAYGPPAETGVSPDVAAELQPVLRWWASVVQLREFLPGDSVGYGRAARVEEPTRGALLGVGYGDGYPRSQHGCGWVELRGVPCPLLGRVSMDLMMVDVTRAPEVREGDRALLLGDARGLTADDLAARSGTISYEILTGIRRRVERRYLGPADEPGKGGNERGEGRGER
jgi:alanine racemase